MKAAEWLEEFKNRMISKGYLPVMAEIARRKAITYSDMIESGLAGTPEEAADSVIMNLRKTP